VPLYNRPAISSMCLVRRPEIGSWPAHVARGVDGMQEKWRDVNIDVQSLLEVPGEGVYDEYGFEYEADPPNHGTSGSCPHVDMPMTMSRLKGSIPGCQGRWMVRPVGAC
jgi:hypothetical protein